MVIFVILWKSGNPAIQHFLHFYHCAPSGKAGSGERSAKGLPGAAKPKPAQSVHCADPQGVGKDLKSGNLEPEGSAAASPHIETWADYCKPPSSTRMFVLVPSKVLLSTNNCRHHGESYSSTCIQTISSISTSMMAFVETTWRGKLGNPAHQAVLWQKLSGWMESTVKPWRRNRVGGLLGNIELLSFSPLSDAPDTPWVAEEVVGNFCRLSFGCSRRSGQHSERRG